MRRIFQLLLVLMPWPLKRFLLVSIYGYKIDPSARIGLSWVYPKYLILGEGASIGHLNVIVNLDTVDMGEYSSIGRENWITGFPLDTKSPHFSHQRERISKLLMGCHSSITKRHHIDCTNLVDIGSFSTLAGYSSQLLTHSVNLSENRQDSKSIVIGSYSFVGTNVVILGGAVLPARSVLGAKSLLNKVYDRELFLYAGVPAVPVKELDAANGYFSRSIGFVL